MAKTITMRYYEKQSIHIPSVIGLVAIIALGFVGYDYLFVQEAGAQQNDMGVSSQIVLPGNAAAIDSNSPLSPEQAALLTKIESIKLDGKIFKDSLFVGLKDITVNLGHIDAGRSNPFEPFAGQAKTTK